ncbi:MAG: DUF6398 domain-containing protein [Rhodospirillaceae bacterium]
MGRTITKTGSSKSTSVPKEWEGFYKGLTDMTDEFCRQHLNDEYAQLARLAIAALCRKRPSPLRSGRPETWGCAVIYALGQVNFLSDKASTPYMTMQELCAQFGIAASTGGNKAKEVREALGIRTFDHRWMLPSSLEQNSMIWMVEWKGLMVDARQLPLNLQEDAAQRGIIPFVPAYRNPPPAGQPDREDIIERYRWLRQLSMGHQTAVAKELLGGPVTDIALRLGLVKKRPELADVDFDDMAPAIDLALYGPTEDGIPRIARYAQEQLAGAADDERALLTSMGQARFSIFEIVGRHPQAGMMMRDMIRGGEVWLMDMGLERGAPMTLRLAMRLIKPEGFWMSTGVTIQMRDAIWKTLERDHGVSLNRDTVLAPDGLKLDEVILGIALSR